jgi:hypothetical protein
LPLAQLAALIVLLLAMLYAEGRQPGDSLHPLGEGRQ